MGEAKKKPQSKNPFAICTAQLKKEFGTSERSEWTKTQMKKYERCVMDIKGQPKKDMKEANMIDSFIENQMSKMVESHLNPQITKSALLRHLREYDTPTTKPVVKPAKPTTKPTRRDNPFINPNPKVNPDPKANTETKPIVKPAKPTTKPTRRDNPFIDPRPDVRPAPAKANTTIEPKTSPITKPAKPKIKPTERDDPFRDPRPDVRPAPAKAITPKMAKNIVMTKLLELLNIKK
jgi:hypothetical protein